MGVHGLWKLIESSGKPVPLETLENRVLAVDVSIWLYQLIKGFQEKAGQSVANAFLLGLFHRICKLLFYRIKPIFVFDGGVPALKRKTIVDRQNSRSKAEILGEKLRMSLLENLAKQEALGKALGESFVLPKMFQPKQDILFNLPPLESEGVEESSSDSDHETFRYKDLHSIDINSEEFLSLPPDMRHDILTELKETRKENSWAKLHLMPEEGGEFSNFQMNRLLKRRAVQVGIEKAEGEMGTRGFTISDLQSILSEQGIELAQRIAADNTTKLLYSDNLRSGIKHLKNANNRVPKPKCEKSDYEDFSNENKAGCGETIYDSKNDSLTQNEILELIKIENSAPSDIKTEQFFVDVLPSSLDLKNDSVKTEVDKELEVNDQALENKSRNNEVELEHGTLPQSNSHCLSSSLPSTSSHPVFISDSESGLQNEHSSEINLESNLIENSPVFPLGENKIALRPHKDNNTNVSDLADSVEEIIEKNKCISSEILNKPFAVNYSLPIATQTCEIDLSSDDSDDFIEVDSECPEVDKNQGSYTSDIEPPKLLIPSEILINSVEHLEDDMFSDIFSDQNKIEVFDNIKINKNYLKSIQGNKKCLESFKDDKIHFENIAGVKKQFESIEDNKNHFKIIGDDKKDFELKNDICSKKTATNLESEITVNKEDNMNPSSKTIFSESDAKPEKAESTFPQMSVDEIIKMKKDLERESDYLRNETSREDRIASTITEQIRLDAQELLQLFGIPYIIAPMEAEAQCAYLDLTNQTQGTITDDSDIWLFGAKNVYKNFFDQKKFVQQFKSTDISKCLKMERDEMIMLALLSGSDYTAGLTGVGAVTALEVIAHFPKTGNHQTIIERLTRFAEDYKQLKLKANISSKLKKTSMPEGFPSIDVVKAYMDPLVDQSTEAFWWSKPNLKELRRYSREKFGWDQTRTDKILQPVFENLNRTQGQGTLTRYFEWNFEGIESRMSKRVEKAVTLLKMPSLLDSVPSCSKSKRNVGNVEISKVSNQIDSNKMMKSKTPAQIARERAAKKVKELRKQGKFGPKSKNRK